MVGNLIIGSEAYLFRCGVEKSRTPRGSGVRGNRRGSPGGRGEASNNGEGGIRTHGTRKGSPVFETGSFNHSDTSPEAPDDIRPLREAEMSPGQGGNTTRGDAARGIAPAGAVGGGSLRLG